MFLLNMFLFIHFLLVVSLNHPFQGFWKAGLVKDHKIVTLFDRQNHKRDFENHESNFFINTPLVTPRYYFSDVGKKKISVEKIKDLYLRKVACLGKNGEVVEAICCPDVFPKPWMILLPTKYKIRCYKPNCRHTCLVAIVKYRRANKAARASTQTPTDAILTELDGDLSGEFDIENNGLEMSFTSLEPPSLESIFHSNTNKNSNKILKPNNKLKYYSNVESNCSQKVLVPEFILELLDLCNIINNTDLLRFSKLHSLCKMKNMYLHEFLNHVNYVNNTRQNLNIDMSNNEETVHIVTESENDRLDGIVYKRKSTVSSKQLTKLGSKVEFDGYDEDYYYDSKNSTKVPKNDIFRITTDAEINVDFTLPAKNYLKQKSLKSKNGNKKNYNLISDSYQVPFENRLEEFTFKDFTFKQPMENLCTSVTHCLFGSDKETTYRLSSKFNTAISTERNSFLGNCCCACTKRKSTCSESLKKMLMALLKRPRPTFASKTNIRKTEPTWPLSLPFLNVKKQLEKPVSMNNHVVSQAVQKTEKQTENFRNIKHYSPGDSVEQYVTYIDKKCAEMYKVYKKAQWDYETNITYHTKQKAMITSLEFNQLLRAVNKKLLAVTNESIMDTKILRQIKLLFLPGMNSLSEIKSNEFEQVLYAMETIYSSAVVSKWNQQTEKVTLSSAIKHVMATSENPDEMKYYWIEWRKATGKRIRSLFEQYVSLTFLAAKTNGFNDASEMWTRYYESEDLIDTFSIHWEEIKPLYVELHAYVRHKLHGFYGDVAGAKDEGTIPAHLTGDIWSQNWKHLYNRVMPYNDKYDDFKIKLPNKLTPLIITEKTEDIFLSMGFTKLPDEFWKNSVITKSNDTIMSCEPSAWDMGGEMDFRIKLCAIPNIQDLFDIHHLLTIIEYYKEYTGLPYAFRNGANPGFPDAIAGAIVLSAHTKNHLKLFGIEKYEFKVWKKESENNLINKLMKIALEKVAFIPYSYILVLWRHKVFTGEINVTNYNSKWWELRLQYQGISPPVLRNEDDFDVGSKQHIAANQPYMKYFLSTILQFQFYEALCKKANIKGALHDCDITTSPAAGSILQDVMSMGSSYHWKIAMQELTGTRKINSKPLMRYFDPLLRWLRKKNKDENIKVGWEN